LKTLETPVLHLKAGYYAANLSERWNVCSCSIAEILDIADPSDVEDHWDNLPDTVKLTAKENPSDGAWIVVDDPEFPDMPDIYYNEDGFDDGYYSLDEVLEEQDTWEAIPSCWPGFIKRRLIDMGPFDLYIETTYTEPANT
jgi:hypothetical protein